ncbi:hypothetical protein H920_07631 [Fukomys damarensis]|uniref:Uncharacterized protein n=1 Tax=Fukomys damarensis TaxID=885580 RepID=A0A091DKH6_FUKDA|nr:hypothetical protein H920_07631 [Fukomys damarensis]
MPLSEVTMSPNAVPNKMRTPPWVTNAQLQFHGSKVKDMFQGPWIRVSFKAIGAQQRKCATIRKVGTSIQLPAVPQTAGQHVQLASPGERPRDRADAKANEADRDCQSSCM